MGTSCLNTPQGCRRQPPLKYAEDNLLKGIVNKTITLIWSNGRGGWNKREGGAKFAKSLNVEVGINMKGGILWELLMHNSNKR